MEIGWEIQFILGEAGHTKLLLTTQMLPFQWKIALLYISANSLPAAIQAEFHPSNTIQGSRFKSISLTSSYMSIKHFKEKLLSAELASLIIYFSSDPLWQQYVSSAFLVHYIAGAQLVWDVKLYPINVFIL